MWTLKHEVVAVAERWWQKAACKGQSGEMFVPSGPSPKVVPDNVARLCATCPVSKSCLEEALTVPPRRDLGFRAGTTPSQRLRLRARAMD